MDRRWRGKIHKNMNLKSEKHKNTDLNIKGDSCLGIVGTCQDMCPESERILRTRERLLHRLEMGQDSGGPIKEFSRPAAGQKPPMAHEVRSPSTLLSTTSHLLTITLNCNHEPLHVIYDFIFDRLRAVRQDLVLQNVQDLTTLTILTRCVRFHLAFSLLLSPHPIARFDPHINFSHLLDCLKHCLILHRNLRLNDAKREELSCVYLLVNLGRPEAIKWAIQQDSLKKFPLMKTSLNITRAYEERNYVRFFRLVRDVPPILQLSVQRAVSSMAALAVEIMNTGYSSANCRFPLNKLKELLKLENMKTVENIVVSQGIRIEEGAVRFKKEEFRGGGITSGDWYFDIISSKIKMSCLSDLVMDGMDAEEYLS